MSDPYASLREDAPFAFTERAATLEDHVQEAIEAAMWETGVLDTSRAQEISDALIAAIRENDLW